MNKTNLSKEAAVAEGREWIAPPSRDIFCIKDSLENSIKVSFEFILNYRILLKACLSMTLISQMYWHFKTISRFWSKDVRALSIVLPYWIISIR